MGSYKPASDTPLKKMMKKSLYLKQSAQLCFASLLTAYSLNSYGIGLGDITVSSYLGQPLSASVPVYGMNPAITSACFKTGDSSINNIGQATFNLRNGHLMIKSKRAVVEPIATLTIINRCETAFTREYTLLIDPFIPASKTTSSANASAINNTAAITQAVSTPNITNTNNNSVDHSSNQSSAESSASTSQSTTSSKKTTKAKKTSNKKAKVKTNQTKKATPKQTAAKPKPATERNHTPPTQETTTTPSNKPRLTISGGNLASGIMPATPLNLAFDTQLKLDRAQNPNAYAEQAMFEDELTVMSNRLTHLDKQFASLEKENQRLKTATNAFDAKFASVEKQKNFFRTLSFLLGLVVLSCFAALVYWLTRRQDVEQEEKEQALLKSMEQESADIEKQLDSTLVAVVDTPAADTDASNDENTATKNEDKTDTTETEEEISQQDEELAELENELDQAALFNTSFSAANAPSSIVEETTKVTDDARLFMAHGRTALAIQLLQEHLIEHPRESAANWMLLLDLLSKEGQQKEFEIAAAECKKYFNVDLNDFDAPATGSEGLESLERISGQLQNIWGTPEAITFLDELIFNTREQPRNGFNKTLFEELILLKEIAQEELPITDSNQATTLNLPEIVMSNAFKSLGQETTETTSEPEQVIENDQLQKSDPEPFEFELIDPDKKK